MNKTINTFLLAGDKFILEKLLRQAGKQEIQDIFIKPN